MLKVYFVDDDELIIEELKSIIDWSKYDFEICGYSTDPIVAIDEILELKPTLVICDVQMDILNGLKLAEKITNINKDTNFCFLSAYDKFDYAVEAIRIGAIRYLKKPVKEDELIGLLKETKEKEARKYSYHLSAILANANPYQNNELRVFFESSPLFRKDEEFNIVVLFGTLDDIDVSSSGTSNIVLYNDSAMEINIIYNLDFDKLKELIHNKHVSVGVSEKANNYHKMGDLLKTARIASKNKFITGKYELIQYRDNPNVDLLIEKIKNINYPYELKKVISELKDSLIQLKITANYIQLIYQVIIYSLTRLKLIEYDREAMNVSVLHFYQSIDNMIEDLLVNFEEVIDQDFNSILINKIKEDINDNLSRKLSLSEYAKKYGYNTSYFSQWFKKTCGISFVEYVINARIEMAKYLITIRPHASLRSIAVEVGYDDYYHFSKIFKKNTGLSPTEFQSNIQHNF